MSGTTSVVLPTYHRPEQLERALRSVLAQTLPPAQIVVVDDNADAPELRARSANVIEAIRSECPAEIELELLQPATSVGGSGARNLGVSRASGELVAFLDDDDWWQPQKLELQLRCFERAHEAPGEEPPGLVYTSRDIVGADGRTKRIRHARHRGRIAETLLAENVIGTTSCAMLPKRVFEELGGFDERLPARQDIDLWVRVAKRWPVDFVEAAVTVQQEHGEGRISRRFEAKSRGLEMFLTKHYEDIRKRPGVLSAHLARIGIHYLKYGHPVRGRVWVLRALLAAPSGRLLVRLVVGVRGSRA
jgi:glycosyltransferase involved in cell wall biosynthesis